MAERRLQAVAAADVLLQDWWRRPDRFPASSAGAVPGEGASPWRTHVVQSSGLQGLEAEVVRLEILDQRDPERDRNSLLAIDLVLSTEGRPK